MLPVLSARYTMLDRKESFLYSVSGRRISKRASTIDAIGGVIIPDRKLVAMVGLSQKLQERTSIWFSLYVIRSGLLSFFSQYQNLVCQSIQVGIA